MPKLFPNCSASFFHVLKSISIFFYYLALKLFITFSAPSPSCHKGIFFPFVGKKRSEKVETLAEHNFQLAEVSIKPHQNHTFTFPKMKIVIEQ